MKHTAGARKRIEKGIVTRVMRALKGKGQLNVRKGQEVVPEEIIGSATVSAGFRILNLSRELQAAPETCEKYLTKNLGQRIYKGELLAYKKGLLFGKKVVISPTDGILDFLNNKTGELRITFMPKQARLPAGVYGIVEDVDYERGEVSIRTEVNIIYGVLGSGRPRDGILHILGKKDDLVGKGRIEAKYDGAILAGGSLFFKEAISTAISAGVSGIISGGINAEDYKAMANGRLIFPRKLDNDVGISIVVCEGFGLAPLGGDIFDMLSQYEGRFIFIDGNKALINLPASTQSSLVKVKNTQLPAIQKSGSTNIEHIKVEAELQLGMKVRIIGNSYFGEQGEIKAIDDSLTLLASGIKDYLVTVETARRKIQVPVANVEVIV